MKYKAVIFDMDGTIVDSEAAWGKAFVTVLSELGIETKNNHPQISGVSVNENWKIILEKENIKIDKTIQELRDLTVEVFKREIYTITLKPGVKEFFKQLNDLNIRIALATSTHKEEASVIFANLGIANFFEEATYGNDVTNKKPDPEVFLKTLDKLKLEKEECIVIEDSPSGVIAAQAAGIDVVAIVWERNYPKELNSANFIVGSFEEIYKEIII